MDISIMQDHQLALLGRRDITARVAFQGATPSRAQLRDALAKKLNVKAALLVIRRIGTSFGEPSSILEASVYKDDAHLARYEQEYVRKRNGASEEPAAPAAGGDA